MGGCPHRFPKKAGCEIYPFDAGRTSVLSHLNKQFSPQPSGYSIERKSTVSARCNEAIAHLDGSDDAGTGCAAAVAGRFDHGSVVVSPEMRSRCFFAFGRCGGAVGAFDEATDRAASHCLEVDGDVDSDVDEEIKLWRPTDGRAT